MQATIDNVCNRKYYQNIFICLFSPWNTRQMHFKRSHPPWPPKKSHRWLRDWGISRLLNKSWNYIIRIEVLRRNLSIKKNWANKWKTVFLILILISIFVSILNFFISCFSQTFKVKSSFYNILLIFLFWVFLNFYFPFNSKLNISKFSKSFAISY